MHLCGLCPFSKEVYSSVPDVTSSCYASGVQFSSFLEWLLHCFKTLLKDNFHRLLFLIWCVWRERNKRVWEDKALSVGDLLFQSSAWLFDFQFYRKKVHVPGGYQRVVRWKTPSVGWLKINMDGAFSASERAGGIGIIIRDDLGTCVGGRYERIGDVSSLEQVEAFAGRCAIRLAQVSGLSPVVFETDSMILTLAVRQQSHTLSDLGPIYADIVDGLSTLPGSLFHHVSRQANKVAHCLARYALLNNVCSSWGSSPPNFISDVLLKDGNPSS